MEIPGGMETSSIPEMLSVIGILFRVVHCGSIGPLLEPKNVRLEVK